MLGYGSYFKNYVYYGESGLEKIAGAIDDGSYSQQNIKKMHRLLTAVGRLGFEVN